MLTDKFVHTCTPAAHRTMCARKEQALLCTVAVRGLLRGRVSRVVLEISTAHFCPTRRAARRPTPHTLSLALPPTSQPANPPTKLLADRRTRPTPPHKPARSLTTGSLNSRPTCSLRHISPFSISNYARCRAGSDEAVSCSARCWYAAPAPSCAGSRPPPVPGDTRCASRSTASRSADAQPERASRTARQTG